LTGAGFTALPTELDEPDDLLELDALELDPLELATLAASWVLTPEEPSLCIKCRIFVISWSSAILVFNRSNCLLGDGGGTSGAIMLFGVSARSWY